MTFNPTPQSLCKLATRLFTPLALLALSACSSPKPTTPPVVTRVSPGAPSEGSNYGAEVVVNSTTATATIVSIDATNRLVVLKRSDGRLAHFKARPGIVEFGPLKVGDEVTIAIGEERALALGKTALPDSSPNSERLRARVPEGTVALAEAFETVTFTAKILSIDQWDSIVKLRMPDGSTKAVRTSVSVNLADFNPGDEVSTRITEVMLLIVQSEPAK